MTLSIYNEITYGEALYYGSVDANSELLWSLEIDWFSDGTYGNGFNDARNMIDLVVDRGRDHYMNSTGFERYMPGRAIAVLDNDDKRYDPWNSSSDLYGYIGPGKLAQLSVKYNDEVIPVMAGIVLDIQPFSEGQRRLVRIIIQDGLQYLQERVTNQYYITTFQIYSIADLVAYTGWPWEDSSLSYASVAELYGDAPAYTPTVFVWQHNAVEAISDLIEAFRGEVFQDASGVFSIVSPTYASKSLTSIDEDIVLVDIEIPQPWEVLWNEVAIVERFYIAGTSGTIWDLGNPIPILAGQTVKLNAMFNYQNFRPVGGTSISGLNFAVNTQEDGGGSDLTASCVGSFDSQAGEGTLVTITNYSASDGYIISADIGGTPIYSPNDSIYAALSTTSQARWGKRTFRLDNPWVESGAYAQAYADRIIELFSDPVYFPTIILEKRPDKQFGKELYIDAIHFTSGTFGIDRLFRIGSIHHEWTNKTGQHVKTTFRLEPYFTPDGGAGVYELRSSFESIEEIDGDGVADEGEIEWVYDGFDTGWNYAVTGYSGLALDLDLTDSNVPGDFPTDTISLLIQEGSIAQFRYKWTDTDGLSTDDYVLFIISTTESGTIVSDGSFFVDSVDSGWLLYEVDLSAWAGETIDSVIFRHDVTAADGLFWLDEVRLGIRLDFER